MTTDTLPAIDEESLFVQGKLTDPEKLYPFYNRLRSSDPVHWSEPAGSWIVTRYDDVSAMLQNDPRISAERLTSLLAQIPDSLQGEIQPIREHLSRWIQYYDQPEH